jgi:hypothetical protein
LGKKIPIQFWRSFLSFFLIRYRALVLDRNPVTSVVFCIDGDVSCAELQPVDGGRPWQGFWDGTSVVGGLHTILAQAYEPPQRKTAPKPLSTRACTWSTATKTDQIWPL